MKTDSRMVGLEASTFHSQGMQMINIQEKREVSDQRLLGNGFCAKAEIGFSDGGSY